MPAHWYLGREVKENVPEVDAVEASQTLGRNRTERLCDNLKDDLKNTDHEGAAL